MSTLEERLIEIIRAKAQPIPPAPDEEPVVKANLVTERQSMTLDVFVPDAMPANISQHQRVTGDWEVIEEGEVIGTHLDEGRRGLRRKDLNPEERRLHDNAMRRRRRARDKKIAMRRKEAESKPTKEATPEHLKECWLITQHLIKHIDELGYRRAKRVERMMGSCAQDVCSNALIAVNREIALSDRDYDELMEAAIFLEGQPAGYDVQRTDPKHASWLMAVVGNRVKSTIETWYRAQKDVDSLERLDTALVNSGGVDTLIAQFKASQPPLMHGAKFPRPGSIDQDLLHMAVDAAITERGLDALVELVLDEGVQRGEGQVNWSEHAKDVFVALDMEGYWDLLCRKTDSRELQGRYARGLARRAIAWLPVMIGMAVEVMENLDVRFEKGSPIGYVAVFPDEVIAARAILTALAEIAEEEPAYA